MEYKHIFVVTYGRSGSTLLLGLLNSIPDVVVKGENYDLFYRLFLSYKSLLETKKYSIAATEPEHPWFGASTYNEHDFLMNLKKVSNSLLSDGVDDSSLIRGFKEIRYFDSFDNQNFNGYFDFLSEMFESSLFILNTRDHKDVSQSGWWKSQDSERLISRFKKFETKIKEEFEGKDNFYVIDMSDLVNKSDTLYGLLNKIGIEPSCVPIDSVISKKHSTA